MRKYIFLGPTLHRGLAMKLRFELDDFVVLPPAKRGDVQRLLSATPGLIAIVDGYFHLHNLAIGHAELRAALQVGWKVWGMSSMGAIRAAEMSELGMRGFGRVYNAYATDPRFRDDEVALLHQPEPPYRPFSEPFIHLRALFAAMVESAALTQAEHDALIATLKPMWFGDRTLERVRSLLPPATVDHWLGRVDDFQWKSLDLADFLRTRPW